MGRSPSADESKLRKATMSMAATGKPSVGEPVQKMAGDPEEVKDG